MGYRSQVRALIYGDPAQICALVAAHTMGGGVNALKEFNDNITRYRVDRRTYDHAATVSQEPDEHGNKPSIWKTVEIEVIDLYGDDCKWYDSYSDVQAWVALMSEAEERGLNTEFVRVGEETEDIEIRQNIQDDGDTYIYVRRSVVDDLPDDRRPVDYTETKEVSDA